MSPVTPAGISAMLRAEAAELEEESRIATSLQRMEAQQRFATSRADTVIRRYAASAASVADSPRSVAGDSVYSHGGAGSALGGSSTAESDRVDPARFRVLAESSASGGTRWERKPRVARFKPAKKKAAALSPDRPESLFGEPPSWSPSAARVLAPEALE